jgi:hypothetical protein
MPDKLQETFSRFTKVASSVLQKAPLAAGIVSSDGQKKLQLQIAVSDLERKPEFKELVLETRSRFYGDYHKGSDPWWEQAIKNFFCRSEYYVRTLCGYTISEEDNYSRYLQAFQRREMQVRYFAPLEYVAFGEKQMDFGSFQIRRFKGEEIAAVLGNSVNEVFYPRSAVNVNRLGYWWLLCASETVSVPKLGTITVDVDSNNVYRVQRSYTAFPAAVESAVRVLALLEWQAKWWKQSEVGNADPEMESEMERGWCGFQIPFVIRVEDNLLQSPPAAPLHWCTAPEAGLDVQTYEEPDEADVYVSLGRDETECLLSLVHSVSTRLSAIQDKLDKWPFMEVALGNLVKGFFSTGLDQVLWHITVLEALVGERGKGVTKRLASRLAAMLGKDKEERESLAKEFRELYKIRCDLVHGASSSKEVFVGHQRMGRELARKSVLWFINLLTEAVALAPGMGSPLPSREEFLRLVDATAEERRRFRELIAYSEKLPAGFPYVQDWVK